MEVDSFADIAEQFNDRVNRLVWCTVTTIDRKGRPRSRILHPVWEGSTGWIATGPTPIKRAHLAASPHLSCNYWSPNQDTCVAECRAEWAFDDATRQMVWDLFANGPAPVGYDPSIIPGWDNAASPNFAALKLRPWRIRVMAGDVMMKGEGAPLVWQG